MKENITAATIAVKDMTIDIKNISANMTTGGVMHMAEDIDGCWLAPLPPKGEYHSENAKIVHFLMLFLFTEWYSPFGGRGAKYLPTATLLCCF